MGIVLGFALSTPMSSIRNSHNVWLVLKNHISYDQEELWCLALNSECHLLGKRMIFRGTVNSCLACPRDIFRYVIAMNACNYVIAHSHPSGNADPSLQDIEFTNKLNYLSTYMEINLVDHIIVTKTARFSFRNSGLL